MRIQFVISGRVDFPALDNLVDYLRGVEQKQVDRIAATVDQLAGRLHTSNQNLKTEGEHNAS